MYPFARRPEGSPTMPAAAHSALVPFHVLQSLLGWSPRECVERGYGEAASVQRCTESGMLLVLDPSGRVVGRFSIQPVRTATGHAPTDYEQPTRPDGSPWTAGYIQQLDRGDTDHGRSP